MGINDVSYFVRLMNTEQIVVFDDICSLCSRAVRFIITRAKHGVFKFIAMQSGYGKSMLSKYEINLEEVDTLILVKDGKLYFKSDSIRKIDIVAINHLLKSAMDDLGLEGIPAILDIRRGKLIEYRRKDNEDEIHALLEAEATALIGLWKRL